MGTGEDWTMDDLQPGATLSVAQIAAMLNVHPVTVQRWLRSGQLHGKRFSLKTGWRVRPKDLEAFVNRRTAQPA